jgi:two-component system, OmpR family, phosphate regulon response regulator PhoB
LKKLLIVDDEQGIRSLVRMTLESADFQILEAGDATEALELAHEHRPQLILLDVMLPDMSGLDVCRRLKKDPALAATAIVMLTAKAQSTDVSEAEQAGTDGYFTKPFSPIALTRKVEEILGPTS